MTTEQQPSMTRSDREHSSDARWSTVCDNHEPCPRSFASGTVEVWTPTSDSNDQTTTFVLMGAEQLKDATKSVYLFDNGRTVRPLYVAGWSRDGSRLFLQPLPTDYNEDGSRRLRADDARPVDFGGWVLGPRRAYHLKISDQ